MPHDARRVCIVSQMTGGRARPRRRPIPASPWAFGGWKARCPRCAGVAEAGGSPGPPRALRPLPRRGARPEKQSR
jgi:hypothetical protein